MASLSRSVATLARWVNAFAVVLADEGIHVVAEIVESKLIVRDGAVRHRLLMRPLSGDGDCGTFTTASERDEPDLSTT